MTLLLSGATDLDGRRVDVRVDGARVAAVAPSLAAEPGEEVLDLTGHWLLPAPAEPHAHLDKALTSHRVPNRTGDLAGAIEAIRAIAADFTHEDLVERATRAVGEYLANGTTAIRTHADVGVHAGTRHLRALIQVRDALAGLVRIQVVALISAPFSAAEAEAAPRLLAEAIRLGTDVVGGAPHLWADRDAGQTLSFDAAVRAGLPLDLHTDETLDPTAQGLLDLARRVTSTGFDRGVTAGHCVSLGVHPLEVARSTAREVARAGIGVVALPQTNLFLQGRDAGVAPPRGLTAVRALLDAGATVGGGGDNLRDPFNPMGRADACEAASLLVTAGHLSTREAWLAVSAGARRCMGLPVPAVTEGAAAEFVAIAAESLDAAVAGAGTARVVLSGERVLATSAVQRSVTPIAPAAAVSRS
ncbi:amidohydrolase family protein [Blastococcus sp. URHD0036]|uniref:amidohydrolase family protein n=1 Tax=Blastococcus sp. URHD0036 TaxID=1380356 RepID=UPI00054DAC7F|nr:amidohydrolase family protein [Blastococcus sp. URHD0036]